MNNPTPEDAGWLLDEYDAEDFWSRVRFNGDEEYRDDPLVDLTRVSGQCWIWCGAVDQYRGGGEYGSFAIWGKKHRAHRIAYRDFGNKLTDDLVIDHLCRNTRCVRPSHLEPVTHQVNVQRGRRPLLNRGVCSHGHEITEDNLVIRRLRGKSVPACKTCLRESARKTYLKSKAADKV